MSEGRALTVYRFLLNALPSDFRMRNDEEMQAVFAEALHRARKASRVEVVRTWVVAVADLVRSAVGLRLRNRFRTGRRRPSSSSRTKDGPVLASLASDIGFALRSLRKSPGFTAVALLTIGLGIGASTLVFSVVHSVLLRPLPYRDSDRLVNVWNDLIEERQYLPAVHPEDFRDYQRMSDTFEEFAAASGAGQVGLAGVLTSDGPPVAVDLSPVTHNFFDLLGVQPALGRAFTEEEEAFNGPRVAVVSHELWQIRFGGDSSLVGRGIELDGNTFTVVGILPRGFRLLLPEEAFLVKHSDVWVPLQTNYDNLPPRNWTSLTVLGRLKDDVTLARAQAEMDQIAEELRAYYPAHAGSGMHIRLVPFRQDVVKQTRLPLLTLFGAVGFVLLIACANVAHLLLLRGTARQRELAMRAALGASRSRIARQVFTESVVLGLLGAVVGLVFTLGGLEILSILQPPNVPRLDEIGINGPVLAFAVGASVVTAVLFGVIPALQASRADVNELLKEGGRAGRSASAMRIRNLLVVGEIAFSLVLLVATGLMIRTFVALQDVKPGYDPQGVLAFDISLPRAGYGTPQPVRAFYEELQGRLTSLPGVEAVGAITKLPLTGSGPLWPYAYDEKTAESFDLTADGRISTAGYFEAMGTRLMAGRFFTEEDHADGRRVVIVEEMLAQRAWPDEDPIGKQLQLARQGENRFATVVGVVEHTRVYDLTRDVREHLYVPHRQRPARNMSVAVRASVDPTSLAPLVREAVWAVDPNVPVNDLRPMSAYVGDAMAGTRFTLLLMSLFGVLALVLASVGIYGVISYAVRQRTHEFGIRIALGARPGELIRVVVLHGARLVGVSIVLGVAVSTLATRSLRSMLFEVSSTDPSTYAAVAIFLAGVALVACYLPARRTAMVDPVSTLRTE